MDLTGLFTALGAIAAIPGAIVTIKQYHKLSVKVIASNALEKAKKAEYLELNDPLKGNAKRQWIEVQQKEGSCTFQPDGYHVKTLDTDYLHYFGRCNLVVPNLVLEVEMTIIEGVEGGLIFRWHQSGSPQVDYFYYFYITNKGYWAVVRGEDTGKPDKYRYLFHMKSKFIKPNDLNILTIRAFEGKVDFFVNNNFLDSLPEISTDAGIFGVASGRYPSEVLFSSVKMWRSEGG